MAGMAEKSREFVESGRRALREGGGVKCARRSWARASSGLATALTLAERGAKVTLVERSPDARRQRLLARGRHARAVLRGRERAAAGGRARPAGRSTGGRRVRLASCAKARWSLRRRATSARSSVSRRARPATSVSTRRASPPSSPILPDASTRASSSPARAISIRAPHCARWRRLRAARRRTCASAWTATRLGRRRDRGGIVIDCRGFAARPQLPELRGVRGEMIRVRTPEVKLYARRAAPASAYPLYVVPRADGEYMIGATMIESAEKGAVSVRSALELLGAAYALHPAFGEAEILEMSADVRPAYPDNEPRIEEREGRIFVNGFYRHGFPAGAGVRRAGCGAGVRAGGGGGGEERSSRSSPPPEEPHLGQWLVENLSGSRRDRTALARRRPSGPVRGPVRGRRGGVMEILQLREQLVLRSRTPQGFSREH